MMKLKELREYISRVLFGVWLYTGIIILIISAFLLLPLACLEHHYGIACLPKFIQNVISIFPKDSFYWLFSSIAQSMAALFGIGALFAAHLFQAADKKIAEAYQKAHVLCGIDRFDPMPEREFYSELTRRINNPPPRPGGASTDQLKDAKKRIDDQESSKRVYFRLFRVIAILMTCIVLLALLALPLSHILSVQLSGVVFMLVLLILVTLGLLKMYTFIMAAARS